MGERKSRRNSNAALKLSFDVQVFSLVIWTGKWRGDWSAAHTVHIALIDQWNQSSVFLRFWSGILNGDPCVCTSAGLHYVYLFMYPVCINHNYTTLLNRFMAAKTGYFIKRV
jgi:hypothetical protein